MHFLVGSQCHACCYKEWKNALIFEILQLWLMYDRLLQMEQPIHNMDWTVSHNMGGRLFTAKLSQWAGGNIYSKQVFLTLVWPVMIPTSKDSTCLGKVKTRLRLLIIGLRTQNLDSLHAGELRKRLRHMDCIHIRISKVITESLNGRKRSVVS